MGREARPIKAVQEEGKGPCSTAGLGDSKINIHGKKGIMSNTNAVVDFFEKLITQFSWQRFAFLVAVIFFVAGGVITYETYTGHFRLNRIERATNLLKELTTLAPDVQKASNPEISEVFHRLVDDLETFVSHKFTPFNLPSWALKALSAFAPWVMVFILIALTSTTDLKTATGGVILAGSISALIGILLPDFGYAPINYLIYPIIAVVGFMLFSLKFLNKTK